jgi:hypothetical protein
MPKNTRLLLSASLFAIVAFLFIQFYWIKTYYTSTLVNFERDINLAFEDGVKKEFMLRCDTIQQAIESNLLDSSKFIISSKFHPTEKVQVYTIRSTKDLKDKFSSSFSKQQLNQPLTKGDVSLKQKIAAAFAQNIRQEDLENHFFYYRTQDLGRYIEEKTNHYQFDTASLRKTFNYYLNSRGIKSNYTFILKDKDSTLNNRPKLFSRLKQPVRSFPNNKPKITTMIPTPPPRANLPPPLPRLSSTLSLPLPNHCITKNILNKINSSDDKAKKMFSTSVCSPVLEHLQCICWDHPLGISLIW